MCFRKRRKKERVGVQKDEEGFLIHHSLACEQALRGALAAAGKGNSNPYPNPLPPYPAPPPEHPVELARKLTVLVPNVKKAMGTWLYFLPTSFPGFLKP